MGELLVQDMPLVAAAVVLGPRCCDVGVDPGRVHASIDELAALDVGVAAGVARLLVPAGADISVGGRISILPFFARASQERTASIFASGENRAFFAKSIPVEWAGCAEVGEGWGSPGNDRYRERGAVCGSWSGYGVHRIRPNRCYAP